MDIKCCLFDLDGTLLDTREDCLTVNKYILERYQLQPMPPQESIRLAAAGRREYMEAFFANTPGAVYDDALVDRAVKESIEFYLEHIADHTRPFPGVEKTLQELKQRNIRLGAVTNKYIDLTTKLFDVLNFTQYFDLIAGDNDTMPLKPNPDMLVDAMQKLQCSPGNTLMIGDNYSDLGAARQAGIKSVFVTYGYGTVMNEKPDFTINCFEELKALLI
ncbi:MAG: HAD family hydrolase [Lentisphaerae bacterium]|nr:HAD family hydrolase [Lentisphaerota bacterium]